MSRKPLAWLILVLAWIGAIYHGNAVIRADGVSGIRWFEWIDYFFLIMGTFGLIFCSATSMTESVVSLTLICMGGLGLLFWWVNLLLVILFSFSILLNVGGELLQRREYKRKRKIAEGCSPFSDSASREKRVDDDVEMRQKQMEAEDTIKHKVDTCESNADVHVDDADGWCDDVIDKVCGRVIGGFRILAEIKGCSGGQGTIFKAVCENPPFDGIEPGTVVALKVTTLTLYDDSTKVWAEMEKCTGELARLSHPNIVKYYGCISEPGTFCDIHAIVQEWLEGETLKQRLARNPSGLGADEVLRVTDAALAGLEYVAANGIVHRDIKPSNIFLCLGTDGTITGVKLIDFEIARRKDDAPTTSTQTGKSFGTFDYMAPDFMNWSFRGDERSDVFSMGVVMHEMITGRIPYQRRAGESDRADIMFYSRWARLHVDGTNPVRIPPFVRRLLVHADEVFEKALAPLPENRYESFAAFRAGVKAIHYRDLNNGDKVYRILQFIGRGEFSEVFKARLMESGQIVAIKYLLKESYADRFYREAKIMNRLDDPCFVHFVDFFVVHHAGRREAFLVMDFLPGMPGSSLRDAIKRAGGAPLPLRETLLAFARFAHGLSVLHSQGIFHRAIKPSKLYYPEGCPERAIVMDFARPRGGDSSVSHPPPPPGGWDYGAPEMLSGSQYDVGCDIYALGISFYEALSGKTAYPRLPQAPAVYAALFAREEAKTPPAFDSPVVTSRPKLLQLLKDMTNLDPEKRIRDAAEIERKLSELAATVNEQDQSGVLCHDDEL